MVQEFTFYVPFPAPWVVRGRMHPVGLRGGQARERAEGALIWPHVWSDVKLDGACFDLRRVFPSTRGELVAFGPVYYAICLLAWLAIWI